MKTNEITTGGITLALIMVCYFLFTGTANILNAVLVPLLLYRCLSIQKVKTGFATITAFLALTVFLHRFQIIFSFFYIVFSILLIYFTKNKVKLPYQAVLLSGAVFFGFIIAIKLTDFIFSTNMETFMLQLAGGNYAVLYLIIALEGLLVGAGLTLGARHLTYLLISPRHNHHYF